MAFLRLMIPVMILALMVVATESTITCKDVYTWLYPCQNYLRYGGSLPENCCTGVQSLYKAAQTTTDRQTACRCLKTASTSLGVNQDYAATLPTKCHVYIPYKISPSTDCNSVT